MRIPAASPLSKIAQPRKKSPRLSRAGVIAKLWPNGEIAFHLPKRLKDRRNPAAKKRLGYSMWRAWHLAYGLSSAIAAACALGLSSVPNSDKKAERPARYGLKGISSLGRRRVRNACFMLTREVGRSRLTFSTVTLPPLPDEDVTLLHLHWNMLIENYRREVSRHLRRGGLSGELIGVSEVQEKRYAATGFPILHAHFVFVGRRSGGSWVLSPARHDYIWRKSIEAVLSRPIKGLNSACQLKSVEKSAESYLGKYMSKGASVVASVVADGFEWALPRQWWSCSRSLVRRMEKQMRFFSDGVPWLIARASEGDSGVWAFYRVVSVVCSDGFEIDVGSYGRLTAPMNGKVRKFLSL